MLAVLEGLVVAAIVVASLVYAAGRLLPTRFVERQLGALGAASPRTERFLRGFLRKQRPSAVSGTARLSGACDGCSAQADHVPSRGPASGSPLKR